MKLCLLSLSTLALVFASCSVTGNVAVPVSDAPQGTEADSEDPREVTETQEKLEVAQARHEIAVLEASAYDAKLDAQLRHAQAAVEMAEVKLATFREVERPNRIATEELNLRSARDRAQEAADELAQVEIMYAEQDLNDMTREFVISRERRNAERAAKRIQIQEGEFTAFKERELPQKESELKLAVDKATAGLKAAEREGEIKKRQHAIGVREAEMKVKNLEDELAKLKAK